MNANSVDQFVCPECSAAIAAGSASCSECGAMLDAGSGCSHAKLLDNPWLVLGMLFFVTAALGLPFLWMSRAFSGPVKALLSTIVILYTLLLLWLFWLVMAWCYHNIAETLRSF